MDTVLHIVGSAQPDTTGICRLVRCVVGGLDRYRFLVWFFGGAGANSRELEGASCSIRVIRWDASARDPWGALRFWDHLRRERVSIVHQHHFGGRRLRWVAHGAVRAKILLHLHWRPLTIGNHARAGETDRLVPIAIPATGADSVIATSKAVANQVRSRSARVVYPGVLVPEEIGFREPRSELAVGTAARLIPIKGIAYLVRAAALLCDEFPNLRLEIAGAGPEETRIQSLARNLGLLDRIRMLGWQPSMPPIMACWDIYVQPSLEESFSITTAEAMAAGLPVVASAVPGMSELVEHGSTGFLVPPGDEHALASRLRQLLLTPELRSSMGARGRQRVRQHFSAERMVAEVGDVYQQLLGRPAMRADEAVAS